MKKNNILGYEILDCKRIKKSTLKKLVRKKMKNEKDEVIVMKMSKMKKLAIAGAVTATTLLSFTTVNAATDGAITKKISEALFNVKVTINGEETEVPAIITEDEDGCVVSFEVGDEVNEIEFNEEDNPELFGQGDYSSGTISGTIIESNEDGSTAMKSVEILDGDDSTAESENHDDE